MSRQQGVPIGIATYCSAVVKMPAFLSAEEVCPNLAPTPRPTASENNHVTCTARSFGCSTQITFTGRCEEPALPRRFVILLVRLSFDPDIMFPREDIIFRAVRFCCGFAAFLRSAAAPVHVFLCFDQFAGHRNSLSECTGSLLLFGTAQQTCFLLPKLEASSIEFLVDQTLSYVS